jgi:cytochrome c-type biogenesis protein CcmF
LIVSGFVGALLGALGYFLTTKQQIKQVAVTWNKVGAIGFWTHCVSILLLIALIFYAMINKNYEYNYVFEHVSDDLPMKYILSAFWEGQEGSFMLWMFWHIILGSIVFFTDKKWFAPVLTIILLVEVWLNSMILGIYLPWDEIKIGSNPMVLIREMTEAPIFANADYLNLIEGRGLNPLLQNYWNVIHPPTTFLGFASTLIPFAYAFTGLWLKEDKAWLKQGIKWGLFSAGILGVGILMGSLWAYEALSFGGYWAWDPVENTSLVPWIVLVAGIHTNLIANNTGHAIRPTYLFYLLSFVLIVYSTTLTRSGILGDTSAHAFTEMGLEWQLAGFNLFFLFLALSMYAFRYKSIPNPIKEEAFQSREFWMFVGSLVLIFSGILITASSSLPVFNTIIRAFNPEYVGNVLKDPIEHYNKYQLWIAVFVSIFAGLTVFLLYRKEKSPAKYTLTVGIHLVIASVLTLLFSKVYSLPGWQFVLLAFAGFFVISSNVQYLVKTIKINPKMVTTSIEHMGFGLMILGTITTGVNKYYLSNPFIFKGLFADEQLAEENVQLIKGKPLLVRGHMLTYLSDTLIGRERHYDIKFQKIDKELNVLDSFILRPTALYSNDFTKIASFNPDTKHYLTKDVFSCLTNLPTHLTDNEAMKEMEDTLKFTQYAAAMGDTITTDIHKIVIVGINTEPTHQEYKHDKHDFGVEVTIQLLGLDGSFITEEIAAIGLEGSLIYSYPAKIESETTRIRLDEEILDIYLSKEENLQYDFFDLKQGDIFEYKGNTIKLKGFDKDPSSKTYQKQEGDIAVSAILEVTGEVNDYTSRPLYVIRGTSPMSIKDYNASNGLHIRLSNINPQTETFTFKIAKDDRKIGAIPLQIATNVPRSDYIILTATVFPGMNLFWSGSLMMMIGLLWGWINKLLMKSKFSTTT